MNDIIITNPLLLTAPKKQRCIVVRTASGSNQLIHSLKWSNGDRWDSYNGMTKGVLPR
jgi:hypothetical protein